MQNSTRNSALPEVRRWTQARDSLSSALQCYLDTCLWFRDASLQSSFRLNEPAAIFQTFDQELQNTPAYVSKLHKAHAALAVARNHSRKLVPINSLPREVLTRIFGIVTGFRREDPCPFLGTESLHRPDSLSEVCSFWNQLVKSTPSLWSCIELVVSRRMQPNSYALASQFLRFSNGVPLSIRLVGRSYIEPEELNTLLEWLSSVVKRTYRLEACARSFDASHLRAILACWLEHGNPWSLKEMDLGLMSWSTNVETLEIGPSNAASEGFGIPPERAQEFFKSITLLRLREIFFRWDRVTFGGLITLSLKGEAITEEHLIILLSSNPGLCYLSLSLEITEVAAGKPAQAPVRLSNLQTLTIKTPSTSGIGCVLRSILPGARPLKMRVKSFGADGTPVTALAEEKYFQDFFRWSNIITLGIGEYVTCYGDPAGTRVPWFPYILNLLPCLGHLLIEKALLKSESELILSASKTCKSIQSLCLRHCRVNLEILKPMIRAYSIQNLIILDCVVYGDESWFSEYQTPEAVKEELSGFVPNLVCWWPYTTDIDPEWSWKTF
ncbi:tigger transposable element-derived protein 6 [Ceratobasidium sp. AG-Ba]|nr:tigger transposable element-derived protein 6 [Ceratobasidium sp. AG-Ba]